MLSLFAAPWALAGLVAVPALFGVYWLRNRFHPRTVSSLMLWERQRQPHAGGKRVDNLRLPLLFYIELALLILLVGAAADPRAAGLQRQPLVVVLDDSFSMLAGDDDSPRRQAVEALVRELHEGRRSVRCIVAGAAPRLLGNSVETEAELREVLEGWHCRSSTARIEEALALAYQLGEAAVLVVSDRAPGLTLERGQVCWWSFGIPRPNLAFVTASRTEHDDKDRVLLEIVNFSSTAQATSLAVRADKAPLMKESIQLQAGATRRLVFDIDRTVAVLQAEVGPDALALDNRVTLVRDERAPVRVDVQLPDEALRQLVEKALMATGRVLLTGVRPEFVVAASDRDTGKAWLLRIVADKEADAYLGPFIIDHSHPLVDGFAPGGSIWGAGKESVGGGLPIVLAGNIPLLTDSEERSGRHDLLLRLRLDLSTVQDSPAWPVLFWNLVHWRISQRPGLARPNIKLGETIPLMVLDGVETVQLTPPAGSPTSLAVRQNRVVAQLDDVGAYVFQANDQRYDLAVNALSRDESDLTDTVTGRWGEWTSSTSGSAEVESFSWLLLLVAAGLLGLHLYVAAANRGETGPIGGRT